MADARNPNTPHEMNKLNEEENRIKTFNEKWP